MNEFVRKNTLEQLELARLVMDKISDIKGEDIVIIDISEVTTIADYFVICSATTDRQIGAIVDHVTTDIKKETQLRAIGVEGEPSSGWVLIDYGGVVVHVFTPQQREYYDLESYWKAGRTIVRMQ